jgi:hypothetical protein
VRRVAREYNWDNYLPAEQKPAVLDASRNLNTSGNNYDETEGVIAHNKVHHSKKYASLVRLSVVKGSKSRSRFLNPPSIFVIKERDAQVLRPLPAPGNGPPVLYRPARLFVRPAKVQFKINPREFNESIPQTVLFIQDITSDNRWENIFVYLTRDTEEPRAIFARTGRRRRSSASSAC